jgi:hypothetical protein
MNPEQLLQKLLTTHNTSDFKKAYRDFPELAETISKAIIQTVTEVMKRESNRIPPYAAQELMSLHKQIGIDRSSQNVSEKSFLPFSVQKAYSELRSFLKKENRNVPTVELRKQSFFQNPEVKAFILQKFPKGLSFQDASQFMDFYTERKNFTVMQGTYGESIQTLPTVKKFPRKTFILTIKDLLKEIGKERDRSFDIFVNEMLANGVHEESVGIPGKTFGWVLYREIDENTLFIEQVQTDLYRIFHRIKKGLEHFGMSEQMYMQIVRQLGGEEKVQEIENTLSKYVDNYFEVLLSAFLEENRGMEIYISSPEIISETVPDEPPTHLYKKIPEKFRFEKVTQAPFDTKGLPIYYKHNASQRIVKYSSLRKRG